MKNPGEPITFNVSCSRQNLDDFDQVIDLLREQTGMKIKRSTLLRILMICMSDAANVLDLTNVYDENSLLKAVKQALKRNK